MVFEISIFHLHHQISSKTPWMEVDLVVYEYIEMRDWWNEWKWKFERIDEEIERKRKWIKSEEIHQINLIVIPFYSLSDDLWLFWVNEWIWDKMNQFCLNIIQTIIFRENSDWKFLLYKISFNQNQRENFKMKQNNDKNKLIQLWNHLLLMNWMIFIFSIFFFERNISSNSSSFKIVFQW